MFQPQHDFMHLTHARPNLFLGIAVTKKQKHAKAVQKVTLARSQYLEAKQKALSQGKTVYPDDPKGEAKAKWKSWQKWRGKAGERALKLAEDAEKKGRLDPLQAAALQRDMADAMAEDPGAALAAMEAGQLPADYLDATLSDPSAVSTIPPWAIYGGGAVLVVGGLLVLRSIFRR
jgi:hypothetical protein